LQFALGITLAVFLGFAVASMVASGQEESQYPPVIAALEAEYASAESTIAWDALEGSDTAALETLESRRTTIAIWGLVIWLAVAGLFSLLWQRVICARLLS